MLFLSLAFWVVAAQALFNKPTPPSKDSFYNAPQNVSDYKNGDIISVRETPVQVRSLIFPMKVKNSWQLLVRSEDSHGVPNAFVTTILEPFDSDPSKVWSYQAWEDANKLDCCPSYSLLFRASADTITTQTEIPFIEYGLLKGWFVVVPDYQGPLSTFTAGIQSGQAVLNSVRAALNSQTITGIEKNALVALYGYSGGSLASGWAAQLQPKYAPELKENLIGAALGGWVTNITLTALAVDGSLGSGLIPNAVNGLISEYPEIMDIIKKDLAFLKSGPFFAAKDNCLINSVVSYVFQRFFLGLIPWFKSRDGLFKIPAIAEVIRNNTLAYVESDGVPEIPLFVFHGEADEFVPIVQPQRAYDHYCEWGIPSLEWTVSENTGHVIESFIGPGAAFAWLEKRFNGEAPISGCLKTMRTTNLEYPGADAAYNQVLTTYVQGIFGADIGSETVQIDQSNWLSKVIAYGVSKLIGLVGPIPLKRDVDEFNDIVGNKTVDDLYKGMLDVKQLFQQHNIDPKKVMEGDADI